MTDPMYVLTITQTEWTWLDRAVKNSAGVPESLRFALDSATITQQYMTVAREWRESHTVSEYVDTDDPIYWNREARMQVVNPPLTVGQDDLADFHESLNEAARITYDS